MSLKPIKLYSHASGPNPWKVTIVLEELGIPYTTEMMDMSVLKQEPFSSLSPNGRVPVIEDPNTGITLWESGAINTYLVETYDKEQKISHGGKIPEKFYENQWLMFQMSGQGPYWGQGAWFTHFHHEKLPSARERYLKEIERTMGVLDTALKGKEWLVGDKCTYADLSFVTWTALLPFILQDHKIDESKYPNYNKWLSAMKARPAVNKALEDRTKAMSASSH